MLGGGHAVGVASGTDALIVAMLARAWDRAMSDHRPQHRGRDRQRDHAHRATPVSEMSTQYCADDLSKLPALLSSKTRA